MPLLISQDQFLDTFIHIYRDMNGPPPYLFLLAVSLSADHSIGRI